MKLRGVLSGLLAVLLVATPASALILGANSIRFDNNTLLTADQAGSLASRTTITAATTQTQAAATQLLSGFNNITTCATASDSVKLQPAAAGKVQVVRNSGAAVLRVWPTLGDNIASLAANLSVDIPVKGELTFRAIDGTTWKIDEKLTLQSPTTLTGSMVIAAAASAGNTVTTITNASQAAARTYTIPDAGANASFVMTAGAQSFSGAITPTAGIAAAGGFTLSPRLCHTGGVPAMASTDGTNATPSATETYISEVFIPANVTLTGAAVLNGATVGTDKHFLALANSSGTVVASTLAAGTTTSGADAYQRIAFTATYAAVGPATYYIALQMNGTTDRYNAHPIGNFGASKGTGTTFGTLVSVTPPTTFTADLGPIASLY